MLELTTLILLALASFRTTRFLVFDSLFEGTRHKLHLYLLNKHNLVTDKLYELISCTFCTGVWVSAAIYWLYIRDFQLSVPVFLNIAALSGAQSLLHVLEPGEED